MNLKFRYLFFILLIVFLIFPFRVLAQERGFLGGPIVPCEEDCTLCDFFVLARNVISLLFELVLVIAPVFILIGGIFILTSGGLPNRVGLGKSIITYTIIGLIIALISWTVLNMVFNTLIGEEGIPWPWHQPQCEGGGVVEPPEDEDRCDERSLAGVCLGGGYYCQVGVIDQVSDASLELRDLLNCMAPRLPTPDAREISSISDNSGGRCFDDWNGQCSSGVDSCTGTCCAHSQYSLHYGGRNCRGTSFAVDFANEQYVTFIRNAANTCATDLRLGDIDILNEGDHIHIELDDVARIRGCL